MSENTVSEPAALALRANVLVLKIASRCNLNCSYCYVYNQGDETWRSQPAVMPEAVVIALLERVRSHCLRHGLSRFHFIFHGGEPLLCGPEFFLRFVEEARRTLQPEVLPAFAVQTNGTLLTEEWCELFDDLGVSVGISVDGPPEVNDRFRVDHAGRGSYAAIRRGIEIARSRSWTTGWGILTVIDPESDPISCYQHLQDLGVPRVDFLLPDATHDSPPLRPPGRATAYADWLIAIFDRWFEQRPKRMQVRIFEGIIGMLLGGSHPIDHLGVQRSEALVIDADGSIEPSPSLKVCGHGFTKLGLNVQRDELDAIFETDLARKVQLRGQYLCPTCERCELKRVCGGGHLPNRYSAQNQFDNPSVFCPDLIHLISHIQRAVYLSLPPALRDRFMLDLPDPDRVMAQARPGLGRRVALPVWQRAAV
jgi:uncharacterized protein